RLDHDAGARSRLRSGRAAGLARPTLYRRRGLRDRDGGGGDRAAGDRLSSDRFGPWDAGDAGAAAGVPRVGARRSSPLCVLAHVRELTGSTTALDLLGSAPVSGGAHALRDAAPGPRL